MGEFSVEWLALREPADHRARSARLTRDIANRVIDRSPVRVLDLACGIDARDVAAQHRRARFALCRDCVGNGGKRLFASRNEDKLVAVRGEFMRQRRTDARGCAGDQRNRTSLRCYDRRRSWRYVWACV